ncbi:hypothetical protein [Nonlabens tegetincola]|nr:hypothetical protein [Nonlabens tegetincola]
MTKFYSDLVMTESNHPSSNGNKQFHKLDYYVFYFAFAKAK